MTQPDTTKDLFEKLNEQQKEAVRHINGQLLILAGAGSGKTRVITNRIAYMVSQGISPFNILAVTFTNKAADEMRNRVKTLTGAKGQGVTISTFHSFCAKVLRSDIEKIGGSRYFTIYNDNDQEDVIKQCMKELDIDSKRYTPSTFKWAINRAKDSLLDPGEYASQHLPNEGSIENLVMKVYKLYQKKVDDSSGVDFGDLLLKTVKLLRTNEAVREKYQKQFTYVMVDEYQDTNYAQYILIKILARKHGNICVVGDDDQNIYTWRGADINNILGFEKDYDNVKVIKLEQNYRSTKNILDIAWNVVKNNLNRKEKKLWTSREQGSQVQYEQLNRETDEAYLVVSEIDRLLEEEEYNLSDFAVFYRTNAQSRVLEDALRRARMNYKIVGNVRFYDRKEIKDILGYLRVIVNTADSISLKRIINSPARGIGKTTIERVEGYARKHDISLFEALKKYGMIKEIRPASGKAIQKFVDLMNSFRAEKKGMEAGGLAKDVIEKTGYRKGLEEEGTTEAASRLENIKELVSAISDFEEESGNKSVESFLERASLVSGVDAWKPEEDYLTLMTLHLAKGLEFPVVFMTGLEEGLFPHVTGFDDPAELEEERRLCYVGITRAKDRLYLTSASERKLYGQSRWNMPSRFIREAGLAISDDE